MICVEYLGVKLLEGEKDIFKSIFLDAWRKLLTIFLSMSA
jgi:hypothetical protein